MSDDETMTEAAPEPDDAAPDPDGDASSPERSRRRRPGYLSVFGFAVLLLLCAAAAAALANFRPNTTRLAWASIWLSGAAVIFTAAALFIRAPRA
jgi:hypothetical protein